MPQCGRHVSRLLLSPALSKRAALQEIDLNLGTQFDPILGEQFIGLVGAREVL